ncbi:uncharacterized protein LOC135485905 [Lineus longissimus]|uniref:uncharacterized protein LOC135485905 n=1 Tax=Lineus longissimus TaxID=88925 RepID=UPI00315CC582
MPRPGDIINEHMSYDAGFELMNNLDSMGEMKPGDDTTADMIGQMDDKLNPSDAMLPTDSNDNTFVRPPFINLMQSIDAKVDSEMREDGLESAFERNSKSSRRKQSKPLRVQHVDLPNIESDQMGVTQPEQMMETTDGVTPKDDQPNSTGNSTCNTPEFMDTEHTISCDFCPGTFNSLHALKDHLINTHAHPMNAVESPSVYPTEYHRLASELYPVNGDSGKSQNFENGIVPSESEKQENSDVMREERQSPSDGSIPCDMPDSNIQGDGEVVKSQGTRIFHPDAYCELCDREFCNKYFLKTHKANKHGIYDNTTSQAPPPPLGPVPPMPSHMFPMFLPQPPPHLPPQPPPQSQPENLAAMSHVTSATTSLPTPIVTSLPSSLPPMPMMMPSLPLPEPSKKSPPVPELTKPKTSETPTSTASGVNGSDMEDYCEICQKHFCNKYYLRKHKLDVHGIQTDPPANKRSRSSHHDSLPFGGMGGLAPPMFLPQNIPNSMTNIMLINPFGPLMALPQSPSLFHAQLPQLPQSSTPLKSSLQSTPGLDDRDKDREQRDRERERDRKQRERDREHHERDREHRDRDREHRERDREHHERDRELRERDHDRDREHEREQDHDRERERDRDGERVREFELERSYERERERDREGDLEHERNRDSAAGSPNSSIGQLSQEALRSMGVLNADAYCELCRKEFCNKYFLKIHRANKHGLFLDDSPMKRSPTGSVSNQSTSSPFDALGPIGDKDGERPIKRETSTTPTNSSSRIGTPGTPSDANMPLNFSTYGEQRHDDRSRQQMEQQIRQHVDQQLRQQQAEQAMRFQADQHMRLQVDQQRREQAGRDREMRQQVDQHMRNQEQMRQHDRDREARHQAEQQMSRPFDPTARPPVDPEAICEICSKEFINKYTLQIHRLNAHGISSRDSETASTPTSDVDKPASLLPQPMPADHPSPLPPVSSSGSDIPTMPTMFSSMIAAKLADRVMCDICNKEVCNKYFLKTHKMKMHGIPPPPGSSTPKPQDRDKAKTPSIPDGKMSPVSPVARLMKAESFNGSNGCLSKAETLKNSDKPLRHDELLKMGIDPEAYCELCKKEFCSKYFLRTHKLNMHGIRSDKPEPPLMKKEDYLFKDYSKERERLFFPFLGNDFPYGGYGHPPQSLPLPPPVSMNSVAMPMEENSQDSAGSIKSSNADTSTTPYDPIQSSPLNLKSDKSKTREPANMIRVKCEICNKELCNKYFLRTHKLNKHGILDESLGLNMNSSFKLTDLQKSMLMAENPLYFNGKSSYMDRVKQEPMDGILDAQLKLNAYESQRTMDNNNGNGGSVDSSQYRNQSPVNDNQSDSSDGSRYFRYYTEVCHICQRRFKSLKWLKTHLVVEHNIKEEYIHDMLRENSRIKDSIIQTCSLCGMLFPDKVGLQIHMLQEHNAEVTLPEKNDISPQNKPKEFNLTNNELASNVNSISQNLKRKYSKTVKQKLHSCSHCDYKTRWLSNIYTHEERKHNIRKPRKHQFSCNKCQRVFRYEHSLYRHNIECHKLGSSGILSNHLTNGKSSSRFRCGRCKTRFATRELCKLHIRQVHLRNTDLTEKKFRCSNCEYKTNFATNYRNHIKQKHAQKMLLEPLQNGPCNGEMATESDDGKKTPVAYATPCDLTSQSSFIMQPFKLMDDTKAGQFVTAVVYLPVYQKISEPVTVSFQLSPTEQ